MKKIAKKTLAQAIYRLCVEANNNLDQEIKDALSKHMTNKVIKDLNENARIAKIEQVPICQDTGFVIVFLEIGQEIKFLCDIEETINQAVAKAYLENNFRLSIVADPFLRVNTKLNTPAIIYYKLVQGDVLKIKLTVKGGGSENKSALKMLLPTDGYKGIEKFLIKTIKKAGADACPPYIIGIGIGGTFEYAAHLAKTALLRSIKQRNKEPHLADFEILLLDKVNKLEIGPSGFGGFPTALAVNIEAFACHIASLPCAINIGCHANRHSEVKL